MFANWSFAEVAFAVQQLVGVNPPTPTPIAVAGSPSRGRKRRTYEILGKLYDLTDKEYELYKLQRKSYLDKIETAVANNINEFAADKPVKSIKDLIGNYNFKYKSLDIPFVEPLDNVYSEVLSMLVQQQQETIRKNSEQDDSDLIELIKYSFFI